VGETTGEYMSKYSHETAPTRSIKVGDIQLAYRRFGKSGGTPLLLLNYFSANMDDWDPKITNGLAAEHDVIIFDYPGVGRSSGKTPSTVTELVKYTLAFCQALDLNQINAVGFSLGGMIVQQLSAEHPELFNRIILLGTGPSGGEGMTFTELSVDEIEDPEKLLMAAFFTTSEQSMTAGRAYLKRLKFRTEDRDAPVLKEASIAELAAIREWGKIPATDRFVMLSKIHQPTLVVHGAKDVVVMPINAFLLAQHIPNAQLIMYPDASHGAQSQYAEVFLEHVRTFLNS
jgi:pimeloyl-ACP methyl ester carboxylesterase